MAPETDAYRIFISYRRQDTASEAGRLHDALGSRFGEANVFMDVDAIEPGVDFKEAIEQAVAACDVLIALIGPDWLAAETEGGRRRLDHPDDVVRLEIEAALARGIRVIPALVENAESPSSDELPEGLTMLARRNAVELGEGARWRADVDRLIAALERMREANIQEPVSPGSTLEDEPDNRGSDKRQVRRKRLPLKVENRRAVLVALLIALAAGGIVAGILSTGDNGKPPPSGSTTLLRAVMAASAEVPPTVKNTSSGQADVTISGTNVCWEFKLSGVDNPDAAHIHLGGPSVSGPVAVSLTPYKSKGCTTTTAAVAKAIRAGPGAYYVNVHSAKYPDGAVRGQLGRSTHMATGLLVDIVPHTILKDCTPSKLPIGATDTRGCFPPANREPGRFYPDQIELSTFTSDAALQNAYRAATAAHDNGPGKCNGTSWSGERKWFHDPGPDTKYAGRRFCYFDGDVAVIVWTNETYSLLGVAREGGNSHGELFSWWSWWSHRIGECHEEGCMAMAK